MAIKADDFNLIDQIPLIGGRHPEAVRRRVVFMEKLLEGVFVIPVINRRVGLDVLLDIIPVGGDVVGGVLGAYMIWEARNLGMSRFSMLRMAANVGINAFLGLFSIIPVVGVIPTFLYKSNTMNLKLILKHLDKHHPAGAIIEG